MQKDSRILKKTRLSSIVAQPKKVVVVLVVVVVVFVVVIFVGHKNLQSLFLLLFYPRNLPLKVGFSCCWCWW